MTAAPETLAERQAMNTHKLLDTDAARRLISNYEAQMSEDERASFHRCALLLACDAEVPLDEPGLLAAKLGIVWLFDPCSINKLTTEIPC